MGKHYISVCGLLPTLRFELLLGSQPGRKKIPARYSLPPSLASPAHVKCKNKAVVPRFVKISTLLWLGAARTVLCIMLICPAQSKCHPRTHSIMPVCACQHCYLHHIPSPQHCTSACLLDMARRKRKCLSHSVCVCSLVIADRSATLF